ncbi:MAG: hypothetical protein JWP48_2619 [Actinoallomurus sp.]|jgi:hypothetical protein|nr:hypothetical protein [Actinoallomurus sp.]
MGRIAGFVAMIAFVVSTVLMVVVCLLGPSSAVPLAVHGRPGWTPDDLTVVVLTWTAIVTGGVGTGLGIAALAGGWRPPLWMLCAGGLAAVVVLAVLPVAGSTDALDYAIYGRIAALGKSPWVMTPGQLFHLHDPVGLLAPISWRRATAVYGPVAVGFFWFSSFVGGASMAVTVSVIKVVSGLSFLLTGYLLDRAVGPESVRRARVHLLWTCNPLMIWSAVVSAHVDVIGTVLMVAAILVLRRPGLVQGAAAGALMGAAIAVKAPFALVAVGLLWTVRRSSRAVGGGIVAGVCVLGAAYLAAGSPAVRAVADKHGSLSVINPWKPFSALLHATSRATTGYELVATAAGLAVVVIAWWSLSGRPDFVSSVTPSVVPAFALSLGWLVTTSVQHPWYDAMLFPLLALLPRSRLDLVIIARFLVSCLAYVPGMPTILRPYRLEYFVHHLYDSWLAPRLLDVGIAAIVVALVWWRRSGGAQPVMPAQTTSADAYDVSARI